jgi:cell volume regulation protein A
VEEPGQQILIAGALLGAGLLASFVAGRLRVPGLVLFLAVGMIAGSDATGWIDFGETRADFELARFIGVLALALILFEGGLTAGWGEIRPVLGRAVSLATAGTLVTAIITGLAAAWLLDLSLLQGLLLGAILSSTDGAAIFGLLRGSTLKRPLARTLEGEAGLNDPVAVLLVLGFIDWIEDPGYGLLDLLGSFVLELGVGAVIGLAVGWLAVQGFQRAQLETAGLYPVASIAVAGIAYGLADVLHGSGFLSVYLAGLALGTATIPAKRTITSFHQGLAWVGQLAMFLVLGLLVFPSRLDAVVVEGTLIAVILVFVARPLAVFVAGLRASPVDRVVLAWAGLRGAVPVVLATFPVIAGTPGSAEAFDVVFFAVVLSTLLQGTTFEALARRLGATTSTPALPSPIAETGTIRRLGAEVMEFPVGPGDAIVGARIRELGLPRDALVNVLVRGDQAIPPRGSMRVESGDALHVLVRQEAASLIPGLVERWRTGPMPGLQRARRRVPIGRSPIFHVRPWDGADGDPGAPARIGRREVVDTLRSRLDAPGAVVVLDDGLVAVTGPVVAMGGRDLVDGWVRRKARAATSEPDRAWWEEVLGALAL